MKRGLGSPDFPHLDMTEVIAGDVVYSKNPPTPAKPQPIVGNPLKRGGEKRLYSEDTIVNL